MPNGTQSTSPIESLYFQATASHFNEKLQELRVTKETSIQQLTKCTAVNVDPQYRTTARTSSRVALYQVRLFMSAEFLCLDEIARHPIAQFGAVL